MDLPRQTANTAHSPADLPEFLRGVTSENRTADRVNFGHLSDVTMLQAAATYAAEGFQIFPCAEKVPLVKNGFKAASSRPLQIATWWRDNPSAQIGLPTGRVNGLFVIDVDGPEGGSALASLNLPETLTVETRPGRFQLWFSLPTGAKSKCTASVIAPQVDTRGDGGYVIGPPSVHHLTGEPYRVVKDLAFALAPLELLEPRKRLPAAPLATGTDLIVSGRRHQTMLSIAGALRARGLSAEMILAQLKSVNERQCEPPLQDAELEKLASYVGSKHPGIRSQPMETSVEVDMESFSEVEPEKLQWLWPGRIPRGKLTIFSGDPGQGKSLATVDLAARISRGEAFPDGTQSECGEVLLLSGEDDAADTVRPRLDAAGADVRRVHRLKRVKVTLADGSPGESSFSLARDIEKLGEAFARFPDLRLFVLDPISMYLGSTDTWKDADVRRILGPVAELAQRSGVTTVGVMHPRKGDGSAMQRIVSGSIAFQAAARCVWGFADDPDFAGRHVMVSVKSNVGPGGNGLAYRIEAANDVARIAWEHGVVSLTADDALGRVGPRDERAKIQTTTTWLRELIGDGSMPVSEIQAEAKASGHAWRSVERAKQNLGIRAARTSPTGPWIWFSSPPTLGGM